MDALNVLRPDCFVPATTVMPEIVEAIQTLLDQGIAYVSQSNVYFDNHAVADYGALAWTDHPHLIELAREHGGFPDDPRKRDSLDFLLWQGHVEGEPEWPSPFGGGRPGWHIECSTIATTVLGLPVTIHGGGKDLIFPHHSSEIAQAESAAGIHPFVRHWMHTAMVAMDGTKMSKSLGNMVFVRELLNEYSADAIRLYLLSHHYREDFEWDPSELDRAAVLANSLVALHSNIRGSVATTEGNEVDDLNELMGDDLRTPDVVGRLSRIVREDVTPKTGPVLVWAKSVLGLQLSDRIFPATDESREPPA
jgi:L-cysteine:1D-myo-inositol 2-amino-2-deoxy-alpha-D-glucopyranoside ligase